MNWILRSTAFFLGAFFLFSSSFIALAEEDNTPELWEEFLSISYTDPIGDIDTAEVHLNFDGELHFEDFQGRIEAGIVASIDYAAQKIAEKLHLVFDASDGEEKISIEADGEIRVIVDTLYMILNQLDVVAEDFTKTDAEMIEKYLGKWISSPLDEAEIDSEAWEWATDPDDMNYYEVRDETLSNEDFSEQERAEMKTFFDALERGQIFFLSKNEYSSAKVVYALRLNKDGILQYIDEEVTQFISITEEDIEEMKQFLYGMRFHAAVVVNPEDFSFLEIGMRLKLVDPFFPVSLLSFGFHVTREFNALVEIETPEGAVPLEELQGEE